VKARRPRKDPSSQHNRQEALLERFLRYVRVDTQSDDRSADCPSTAGQLELQRLLKTELEAVGVADVCLTPQGYLLATLPATSTKPHLPVVAFLAHVDTAPDFSGRGVNPVVHRHYNGEPIRFPDNPGLVLDPALDPALAAACGKDLVTASGKTLLGADDKAGVAVLVTLADWLIRHPEIPHGPIRLCFTPDEEIGRGVDHLDLAELGADVAYTLDGHGLGEISWETFSADAAEVTIEGVSTHPGEAKARGMVNAIQLAARLLASLPRERCAPETTDGRQGFIHPVRIEGTVERASLKFILRDFDLKGLAAKRSTIQQLCRGLQAAEPRARVRCRIRKQYRNMAYWLLKDMRPVERAREAILAIGLEPHDEPVRGGTDGSRLTERGLPTPNLFAGEHNIHGPLEWVAVQDMDLAVSACAELASIWARGSAVSKARPKAAGRPRREG
jgi:tripeptide aminopeptidase